MNLSCYTKKCVEYLVASQIRLESIAKKRSMQKGCFFILKFFTSDELLAGTDADVKINIIGTRRESGFKKITDYGNLFERGFIDVFSISLMPSIGNEITELQVKLSKEGTTNLDDWSLDKIVVIDVLTEKKWYFVANQKVAPNDNDFLTLRPQVKYSCFIVDVYTSDLITSGTNADVEIKIYGENGSIDYKKLDDSHDNFEQGCVDSFVIRNVSSIGCVTGIQLRHNGSDSEWSLDKIVITDVVTEKKWFFVVRDWVKRDSEEPLKPQTRYSCFLVDVYTSDLPDAGTNSNVKIRINGELDFIDFVKLDDSNDNFERGSKDSFALKANSSIGDIINIQLQHDGTDREWHLHKVVITDALTNERWFFVVDDWVSSKGCVPLTPQGEYSCFVLDFYTSDQSGAGTDAQVSVNIVGENGKNVFKTLDDSLSFERGDKDTCVIKAGDNIGNISEIIITQDGKGIKPDWRLDRIVITDMVTEKKWFFIVRENIKANKDYSFKPQDKYTCFMLDIYTSDVTNAGTDARIEVNLIGTENESGFLMLDDALSLEKGDHDACVIKTGKSIGHFKKLIIKNCGGGAGPDWHLDRIVVTDLVTENKWELVYKRWIKEDETDEQSSPVQIEFNKYKLDLYSKDKIYVDMGTDILVSIVGEKDDILFKKLVNPRNGFGADENDSFESYIISADSDIGNISKIKIKQYGPKWRLDKIVVTDCSSENKWIFDSMCWIRDDDEIIFSREKGCCFKVDVKANKLLDSNVNACVAVSLVGKENKKIGFKSLTGPKNDFEREQVNSFTFSTESSIGDLANIIVVSRSVPAESNWRVDEISVKDLFSEKEWMFYYNNLIKENGHCFDVELHTSESSNENLDVDVSISLVGEKETLFFEKKGNIEKNETDFLTIFSNLYIGDILKIIVTVNDGCVESDWFFDRIVVNDIVSKRKWLFENDVGIKEKETRELIPIEKNV